MTDDSWENTPFPEYTEQQIAEIIKRSPVVDVARELGIQVADRGDGTFASRCPWCREPHFAIDQAEGKWNCHACAEGGRDVVVLVCKMRDLWRADAIQWLEHRMASRPAPAVPARLKSEEPPYNVQGTAPENTL